MKELEINGQPLGPDSPPFLVAEIGMNHNGDLELAKKMIKSAAESGADAVKFQTFRTDRFLSEKVDNRDQYRRYELSREDHEALQASADAHDVTFLSTPFDRESVDLLDDFNVPCFKIASSDLTNYPFLEYIAETGKPIFLSTGYSTLSEVATAVEQILDTGNEQLVLLQCVSTYPAEPEEMNLEAMRTLRESFDRLVGLSDHTQYSPIAPIVATSLGAVVIEKHFTTDNDLPGFDHEISENPETFATLVEQVHTAFKALGSGRKVPRESELDNREGARRSLFWDGAYTRGETVNEEMFVGKRPGDGIPPERGDNFEGERLSTDVKPGRQVRYSDIDWDK